MCPGMRLYECQLGQNVSMIDIGCHWIHDMNARYRQNVIDANKHSGKTLLCFFLNMIGVKNVIEVKTHLGKTPPF